MARRFARRRKPRVVWLPTFGAAFDDEAPAAPYNGIQGELDNTTGNTRDVVWDAFPLTYDYGLDPEDAQAGTTTLKDLVGGSEWSLRRIVGKAFISATAGDPPTDLKACALLVGLGFIVVKTYDDGSPTTDFNDVNPLSVESMNDPWIWRRTWMLGPYGVTPQSPTDSLGYGVGYHNYPSNTAMFGSGLDGPHIDSQVNRRIHTQERLFAVLAFRNFCPTGDSDIGLSRSHLTYMLDYRLLGIIRAGSTGNRGNASR